MKKKKRLENNGELTKYRINEDSKSQQTKRISNRDYFSFNNKLTKFKKCSLKVAKSM